MMVDSDCGEIPVVSPSGVPVGVVTDRDITCRTVAKDKNPLNMTAGDCMTTPCVTVTPDTTKSYGCSVKYAGAAGGDAKRGDGKGDKVYVEGNLKLSHWNDKATGEAKHGLQIAAWKVSKMGAIGQRKLKTPRTGAAQQETEESTLSA